jgi:hypothetical protein
LDEHKQENFSILCLLFFSIYGLAAISSFGTTLSFQSIKQFDVANLFAFNTLIALIKDE